MDSTQSPNLYTTSQAANVLKVSRITIFRWIKDGSIKATKIGRNYFIHGEELVNRITNKKVLSNTEKQIIKQLVDKTISDYGETIRMLGRE